MKRREKDKERGKRNRVVTTKIHINTILLYRIPNLNLLTLLKKKENLLRQMTQTNKTIQDNSI